MNAYQMRLWKDFPEKGKYQVSIRMHYRGRQLKIIAQGDTVEQAKLRLQGKVLERKRLLDQLMVSDPNVPDTEWDESEPF